MTIEFDKKVMLRVRNTFPPRSDVKEAFEAVRAQRVPGEFIVVLPGNGGVSAIVFIEKEKILTPEEKK